MESGTAACVDAVRFADLVEFVGDCHTLVDAVERYVFECSRRRRGEGSVPQDISQVVETSGPDLTLTYLANAAGLEISPTNGPWGIGLHRDADAFLQQPDREVGFDPFGFGFVLVYWGSAKALQEFLMIEKLGRPQPEPAWQR